METYIDYCINNEGEMLQVAMRHSVGRDGTHNFSVDLSDTKTRSITTRDRLFNWLILKLGGILADAYTREYMPCLHLPPIEFSSCEREPSSGVLGFGPNKLTLLDNKPGCTEIPRGGAELLKYAFWGDWVKKED